MVFTSTTTDVGHFFLNNIYLVGHFSAGFMVALAVNKIAHNAFNVSVNSYAAWVIKGCAFAAGIVTSFYLTPYTVLTSFAGRKALELFVLGFLGVGTLSPGSVAAWLGQSVPLVLCGAFGANIGACL